MSIWYHIESFEVIIFLMGQVERFQCVGGNDVSERHSVVVVFDQAFAGASLAQTEVLHIVQEGLLLFRQLMANASFVTN